MGFYFYKETSKEVSLLVLVGVKSPIQLVFVPEVTIHHQVVQGSLSLEWGLLVHSGIVCCGLGFLSVASDHQKH